MSPLELSLRLPGGIWQRVREIRKRVFDLSSELSPGLREALVMASAELVENAVKYGDCVSSCEDVLVHVAIEPARILVEVRNGISDPDLLAELLSRVEQIRTSEDREALYVNRLSEMLANPTSAGKLGLYRVAFEGGFDLECHLEGQTLLVRATRGLT